MPLHQDLLTLARELVDRNPAAPVEADLRRGISTAYYALFHLLVHESATRIVAIPDLRARVERSFDHRVMKVVCLEYANLKPDAAGRLFSPGGQAVPQQIQDIASEFVLLQQARHQADYDTAATIAQSQADTDVMRAEIAFLDWVAVQADPAAATFLAELPCRGIARR